MNDWLTAQRRGHCTGFARRSTARRRRGSHPNTGRTMADPSLERSAVVRLVERQRNTRRSSDVLSKERPIDAVLSSGSGSAPSAQRAGSPTRRLQPNEQLTDSSATLPLHTPVRTGEQRSPPAPQSHPAAIAAARFRSNQAISLRELSAARCSSPPRQSQRPMSRRSNLAAAVSSTIPRKLPRKRHFPSPHSSICRCNLRSNTL
jgi:hypothetical protein